MTKPTLLAMCSLFPDKMEILESRFDVIKLYNEINPEAKLNEVKNSVKALIATMNNQVKENLISALPQLEIIALNSVGYDNVDLDLAKSRKIIVTNTPDVVTADTADTAMGLLLNVSRRYVELDAFVRVGHWQNGSKKPISRSLTGKKVGIIGLGKIGQAIAKRCEAFEMDISYFGRNKKAEFSYHYYDDLIMMAYNVDYLIAVVPGGEETKHMVNDAVLSALGSEGFFINVARGSVVDEDALVYALKNKIIAGAGLDVFTSEPIVPDALKTMDNVVLLPHVGAATFETLNHMGDLVVGNLLAYLDKKPVLTAVK
jgi:lactate dehydrogenase-like 2-hydroxyacid dehydrogenase